MSHVAIVNVGWLFVIAGSVLLIGVRFWPPTKPRRLPPDPRPPAVNLVDPRLDEPIPYELTATGWAEVRPPTLACGHCGHPSTGSTMLEAIAADQAHFRARHAFALALQGAAS